MEAWLHSLDIFSQFFINSLIRLRNNHVRVFDATADAGKPCPQTSAALPNALKAISKTRHISILIFFFQVDVLRFPA